MTQSFTRTATSTGTRTRTATYTRTATNTRTPTGTFTEVYSPTVTMTATVTPTASNTPAWQVIATDISPGDIEHLNIDAKDGVVYFAYSNMGAADKGVETKMYTEATGVIDAGPRTPNAWCYYSGVIIDDGTVLSAGKPIVCFNNYDAVPQRSGYVFTYTGVSWTAVGSAPVTAYDTRYTDMALQGGVLYWSFSDYTPRYVRVLSYTNATGWQAAGGVLSSGSGDSTALYSRNGVLYCAYRDAAFGNKIIVKTWDGTAWSQLGGPVNDSNTAYTDIYVDSAGTPYVSFLDLSVSFRASVYRYNGSSWVPVGSKGFTPGSNCANTAITGHGQYVYCALADYDGTNYRTYVYVWDGSSWTVLGGTELGITSSALVGEAALAIDESSGYMYLARCNASKRVELLRIKVF